MLLGKIIGRFKMTTAKAINAARGAHGIRVWQRYYYEHAIRGEKEMDRIREYILGNPSRWMSDPENASSIDR
jgi:putative transposase